LNARNVTAAVVDAASTAAAECKAITERCGRAGMWRADGRVSHDSLHLQVLGPASLLAS